MNKSNLLLQLMVVSSTEIAIPTIADPRDERGLEASLLAMSDCDFRALTNAARCGGAGGAAPAGGFNDLPRLFRFPSYGQA